ncbi:hypothetical protein Tco_1211265 [Tanacetum coccineum]
MGIKLEKANKSTALKWTPRTMQNIASSKTISFVSIQETKMDECFGYGDFAIGRNSSFVALIPKVLDPKGISGLPFPSMFRTAFLPNSKILVEKASILVSTGVLTTEFLYTAAEKGDPLAPFLFLLIMESLNYHIFRAVEDGEFSRGYMIDPSTTLSIYSTRRRGIIWLLASMNSEGWGVSSFFALNRALLFKWVWHYLSHDNSLWSRIISALHGLNGHVLSAAFNSTWSSIITEVNSLKVKGVDLISHCKIRVGKDGFGTLMADGFSSKDVRSMLDEDFLLKMEEGSLPFLACPLCDHCAQRIRLPFILRCSGGGKDIQKLFC